MTLSDLKLAIEGTIVMSQRLRASLDAMYDARIPERWQKVRYVSIAIAISKRILADFLGIGDIRFLVH